MVALAIPINNMFLGKMLDVLTAENQQLRSNGDLRNCVLSNPSL